MTNMKIKISGMKSIRYSKAISLLACAVAILSFASCVRDTETEPGNGCDAAVTFTIQVPGSSNPAASRALTSTDEKAVTQVDVLLFAQGSGGLFKERATSTSITPGANANEKSFTVSLSVGNWDMVVLANASDVVSATTLNGQTKAQVMTALTKSLPADDKWNATTGSYSPIPLWGDMGNRAISIGSGMSGSSQIAMTRMLASVDVQVTGTAAGKFKIMSVDVYNYNTQGMLAPAAANWNAGTGIATAPTVAGTLTKGPIVYNGTQIDGTNNRCLGEIYIFEAENHTTTAHTTAKSLTDRTCLVVGGVYDANSDGTYDEGTTYYRVDFSNASTQYDILRNHKYTVSITNVTAAGAGDSETAFSSAPVNIEATVVAWNEAGPGNINVDGQYSFSVSQGEFTFPKTAGTDILTIKTDVPTGWTATVHDDLAGSTPHSSAWLTLSALSSTTPVTGDNITLTVTANGGDERTAYIHIKAGRFTYVVKVTQEEEDLYVGRFGGELKAISGTAYTDDAVWMFDKSLYTNRTDASTSVQWKTANTAADVATSGWNGKLNTLNLGSAVYNSPTVTYPAFNLCFTKNSGSITGVNDANYIWYLPALNQLMGVWVVNESFGAYVFPSYTYWSATEVDATTAWYVSFDTGTTNNNTKAFNRRVRCVREVTP